MTITSPVDPFLPLFQRTGASYILHCQLNNGKEAKKKLSPEIPRNFKNSHRMLSSSPGALPWLSLCLLFEEYLADYPITPMIHTLLFLGLSKQNSLVDVSSFLGGGVLKGQLDSPQQQMDRSIVFSFLSQQCLEKICTQGYSPEMSWACSPIILIPFLAFFF